MTKATNQLSLVEGVRCHFHPPHGSHRFVHLKKLCFCHLDVQVWSITVASMERVFMEFDCEGF